jgi:ribosomal protein S18 acetylase RimI-like enzyme
MSDCVIARLDHADEPRLQEFLERCSDYYLLHEGRPTPADAARHELSAVPDGRSSADLRLLGMTSANGELVAVAQLLRDYPAKDDWWIGMLLVAPSERSRGIGALLFEHVMQLARAEGGRSVQLVVSLRNPRAKKFWEGLGFIETRRLERVDERSGQVDEVVILSVDVNRGMLPV